MTYCLALWCRSGIVFVSDSRTNAGVDNITIQQKMRVFEDEGKRMICLLTSGNLSLSQTVISLIEEDLQRAQAEGGHAHLLNRGTMFETARYVGEKVREVDRMDRAALQANGIPFNVHFLVGGQIAGHPHEIFLVYPQGNCLRATRTSPFLQIGEYKYGKPILDRGFTYETELMEAVKFAAVSMEGTMKSNVSVGPPLDILAYEADSLRVKYRRRIEEDHPYLAEIRNIWGEGLVKLVRDVPPLDFPDAEEAQPS